MHVQQALVLRGGHRGGQKRVWHVMCLGQQALQWASSRCYAWRSMHDVRCAQAEITSNNNREHQISG